MIVYRKGGQWHRIPDAFAVAVHRARVKRGMTVRDLAVKLCGLASYEPDEDILQKIAGLIIGIEIKGADSSHVLYNALCVELNIDPEEYK